MSSNLVPCKRGVLSPGKSTQVSYHLQATLADSRSGQWVTLGPKQTKKTITHNSFKCHQTDPTKAPANPKPDPTQPKPMKQKNAPKERQKMKETKNNNKKLVPVLRLPHRQTLRQKQGETQQSPYPAPTQNKQTAYDSYPSLA